MNKKNLTQANRQWSKMGIEILLIAHLTLIMPNCLDSRVAQVTYTYW